MSVSHGYNTIARIEYGGCGEDKKKDSHQDDVDPEEEELESS